jgi:thioredoxin 1
MASPNVLEFTDANFESEVMGSAMPVLVDFWAEWCMPCRLLAPEIDALAEEFKGRAKVGKLDTDANQKVAIDHGITAIPTVILFSKGQVANRFVGLTSREDLSAALGKLVQAH